jgi:hypothetical protein
VVVGQAPRDQVRRDLVAHAHVQVKALGRHIHQPVEHLQPHLQTRCWRTRRDSAGATTLRPKPKLLETRSRPRLGA